MTVRLLSRVSCALGVITVAACFALGPTAHAQSYPPQGPHAGVDAGFFYDALEPDGDWLWIEPYGWVWAPNDVAPFWRPYTVGHWEWTDWGWTWVSAERWGWATYHYGRWVRADRHGWVWIPGDVWGPAWVAWRNGPGVVGWAPLPPEVRFRTGIGLEWGGIDIDVAIHLDNWCFVDDRRFADRDVDRYAYPVGRNVTVIRGTRDATRVRVEGPRIVNEGIDYRDIERRTQRAIPMRRIVDSPRSEHGPAEVVRDEVRVFHPEIHPAPPDAAPPHGRKPAESARPPADRDVEVRADQRWDRNWNKDWDKLQKLQKSYEPVAPPPPARPRPGSLEKVRDENMAAAENAHRELVAERERAVRQAERAPKGASPKKDEKKDEKKKH
jgi:hypothetical protein